MSSTTAAASTSPTPVGPGLRRFEPTLRRATRTSIGRLSATPRAEGVRRGCISEATEQGFPKYVWAWLGGDLYEARHLNGFAGKYKGYRLEPPEYPRDSDHRLDWPPP